MKNQDSIDDSKKDASCSHQTQPTGTGWLIPLSGALTAVVAVNVYIAWYLLVAIPVGCADISARSHGSQTCGIEPGAYVIAGVSIAIIVIALYAFLRWNLARSRNRNGD